MNQSSIANLFAEFPGGYDAEAIHCRKSKPVGITRSGESQRTAQSLALIGLVLASCKPVAERCQQVELQSLSNQAYERGEEQFQQRISVSGLYDYMTDSGKAKWRRAVRFEINKERRRSLPDSVQKQMPPPDSNDPLPQPPPRPSDMQWYGENCYNGKPR